jgi:hypothetical protein
MFFTADIALDRVAERGDLFGPLLPGADGTAERG